ncbi:MAG: SLC13 family permease [Solirubrobacterales bacterium]
MSAFALSIAIFVLAYAFIVHDKIHRTLVALAGAVIVVFAHVITQKQAVAAIDFNTLGLLIGMMIIVAIMQKSGVFEYMAIQSVRAVKGHPLAILAALGIITAFTSAFLNNVTIVMLMVPITYAITDRLEINPIPYLFTEILASNIGGTATLIGDPPNIMIGSAVGFGFMDFIRNVTVPNIIILLATVGVLMFVYRKALVADDEKIQGLMTLNAVDYIREWNLMWKSVAVMLLTIIGFLVGDHFHIDAATIALAGAVLLLLLASENPEEIFISVEWSTIFFFIGLFVMVGGLEATGVIEWLARESLKLTGGQLVPTGMLVLWMSAILSAFVDNIPLVAAMIPMLQEVGRLTGMQMDSIWWALSLGACLGGNGTLVGASANVVVAGLAARYGNRITFMDYLKVGFPLMILSMVISSVYMYLVYWM